MVDKYMIPSDQKEFKWLNENLSNVTALYEHQRQITADS